MIAILIAVLSTILPCQAINQVSNAKKQEFIEFLKTLPTDDEFYTDEAVEKVKPFLPVLLALTEKDIEKYDFYPFAAISKGLSEHKEQQNYVVRHFAEIRHPELQLLWGAILFDVGAASPNIIGFLRHALKSPVQTKLLSDITGPHFKDFKKRLLAHPITLGN